MSNASLKNHHPQDPFAAQLQRPARKKKRILFAFGALLLVAAIGTFLYLTQTQFFKDTFALVNNVPTVAKVKQNPDLLFDNVNSDVVNILLIGQDVNYKIIFENGKPIAHVHDEETLARSDTMILLSLDRRRKSISMVSFPRDSLVHMPPNKYGVRVTKLNAAHAYGGPEMLEQALSESLGITVHRYASIHFDGFKSLIDEVGGIEVDVIGALRRDGSRGDLKYDDNWGNLHIDLKPGMQHLDGAQAHDYVRFRMDIEGDPGRIRRQQQVMRALAKKMSNQPIYKIPGLITKVRQQFTTDMTDEEAASAAFFARSLENSADVQPMTMFGIYGKQGSVVLNRSKNIRLLSYLLDNTFQPDLFLNDSPYTEKDELGRSNASNPRGQAVLRAAGLLDEEGNIVTPRTTQSTRRVRNDEERSVRAAPESDLSSSRLADTSSSSKQSERPRVDIERHEDIIEETPRRRSRQTGREETNEEVSTSRSDRRRRNTDHNDTVEAPTRSKDEPVRERFFSPNSSNGRVDSPTPSPESPIPLPE